MGPEDNLPIVTQAYYARDPPQVSFQSSTSIQYLLCWYCGVCVQISSSDGVIVYHNGPLLVWLAPLQPLENTNDMYICLLVFILAIPGVQQVAILPTTLSSVCLILYPASCNIVGYTALAVQQSQLFLLSCIHSGERSIFLVLVPPDDTIDWKSVVRVQFGVSNAVSGYQVDNFTCT